MRKKKTESVLILSIGTLFERFGAIEADGVSCPPLLLISLLL